MRIDNASRFGSALGLRLLAALAAVAALGAQERSNRADDRPDPAAAERADEEAIRKNAELYVAAYRDKNVQALADQYTPQGEIVDTAGNIVRGRQAIAEEFQRIFAAQPDAKLSIAIASVRVVAPGVAIEDGTTKLVTGRGQPPVYGHYGAVHVKQQGHWLIASSRDLLDDAELIPIAERLKPLEFLIGEWVDESQEAMVATSYRWGEGRGFLIHEFTVKRGGAALLKGTERIGWDPLRRTIMSWSFDSAGGHGQGAWTWDRDHWVVKMTGVSAAGAASSATVFLTPVNKDHYRWHATNRIVGEASAPDVSVTVVRKPPGPHENVAAPKAAPASNSSPAN
jgi:uncharacterized protein (TIGR02246 family)